MINESEIFRNLIKSDEYTDKEIVKVFTFVNIVKRRIIVNIFKDEYYALYEAITKAFELKSLVNINLYARILENSIDDLILNKNINIDRYGSDIDEAKKLFARDCIIVFKQCLDLGLSSQDDFNMSLELYIDEYRKKKFEQILLNSFKISEEGITTKGKLLKGVDEANKYYQKELNELNLLLFSPQESYSISSGVDGLNAYDSMEEKGLEGITCFGIEEVDSVIGDITRGELISILGETGGGKTRNAINLAYRAIRNKKNILWLPLEGTPVEVFSLLLARHIAEEFDNIPVTNKDILKRTESYYKYKDIVDDAKIDLFTNPNYGKFYIESNQTTVLVENLEGYLEERYDSQIEFDLLVIDYLSLMQSQVFKNTTEIVSAGAKICKRVALSFKGKGVAVVLPHQLSKEAVVMLMKEKEIPTLVSADSTEVVKSSNISVVIYSSEEEKLKSLINFIVIKTRNTATIPKFTVYAQQGNCLYASINR